MKKCFVTIALPYINGVIHIGHIYENFISKLYFSIIKKYYFCKNFSGLDCHGLIKNNNLSKILFLNKKKLKYYNINIKMKKTNSFINIYICNWIYIYLLDKNKIFSKIIKRFFNKNKNFFIPDKYIKIYCNICKQEILNYYCINCKNKNFYIYSNFKNIILKKTISLYLKNYIFKDWDFSRSFKYNGIKIIGKKDIFFYVWYDAINSYISNNIIYFKNVIFYNIFQIIGKDIIYFHNIFNIILKYLNFNKTKLIIHGFINNKKKISKSKFIFFKKNNKIKIIFYFMLKGKDNLKDINYNFYIINNFYKTIFYNKIVNLFFRIRKIIENYDNKIIDFFFYKKNHFFSYYLLKKKKINFYFLTKIIKLLNINKNITKNEFWKKQNNFLIQYYYSKNVFNYIKIFNIILFFLNKKQINNNAYKNFILYNLKKINEI